MNNTPDYDYEPTLPSMPYEDDAYDMIEPFLPEDDDDYEDDDGDEYDD